MTNQNKARGFLRNWLRENLEGVKTIFVAGGEHWEKIVKPCIVRNYHKGLLKRKKTKEDQRETFKNTASANFVE